MVWRHLVASPSRRPVPTDGEVEAMIIEQLAESRLAIGTASGPGGKISIGVEAEQLRLDRHARRPDRPSR